ncbi:uncharacterized protein LOC8024144 [Ixodes scapularis]|uniref:uncharacterized protein LOC8024144 n=1 Tax=Ixodes scapularis TaxID=6945 RepID=UPI001A9E1430|nr:uncharacterized protein LOC8024144 [Ixodes scapularis]
MSSSLGQSIAATLPKFVVQTLQGSSGEPSQCVTTAGEEGVCLMAKTCQKQGGLGIGRCSDRPDVDNVVSCGAEVSQEDVVFRNADYPSNQALFGQCKITVNAKPDICQLRLDFQEFVLSPPETCGPRAGFCVDDAFSVSAGVESASYPALCGQNSGQHMYVDMSQAKQAYLSVRLNTKSDMDRRWSIRITQISCWSPGLAPEGCLQYHTKASDVISSFNFVRNPTGFHYFAGLHYTICIRRQLGFCSIIYRENGFNGFRLSPLVNQQCKDAYLLIPTGSLGSVANGNLGDRFCGVRLAGNSVASDLAPFRVSFVTAPRIGYAECPCRPATVILPPGTSVVVPTVVDKPTSQNTVVVGNALVNGPPSVPVFQPVPAQVVQPAPVVVQPLPVVPVVPQPAPVVPVVAQPVPVVPVVAQPAPVPVVAQPAPVVPVVAQPAPVVPVVAQPAPVVPVVAQPAPVVPVVAQPAPVPVVSQPAPVVPLAQPAPVPVVAQPAPVLAQPAPVAPAQAPVFVVANNTQPQFRAEFRQLLDEQFICRAGGFSVRYSQIPCGC